jgi:Ca-activated chloride channel family protein
LNIKPAILIFFVPLIASAQSAQADKNIRAGNEFYKQQQFEKAAIEYSKAIEADPNRRIAKFNLGNSLHKQKKQDEAVKVFTEVAGNAENESLKAKAFYNKGAVLSQQEKLEESIEAYKNALRINSDDREARENLQKALMELKKKKQPEKKKEQEKKKKQQEQPQSKMSPKEAQQRLQLLAQKEKEVQQRIQKEKTKTGGSQTKDW